MAESPMTLSEHLARQQASLSAGSGASAPNVATVIGRIGRVAAVIAQELAHAALRDQLGYAGGSNVTGDQVKKLDVWGRRRLAYEILKNTEGIYAVIDLQATPAAVTELDRQLRLNESVLRTKVIRPEVR